MMIFYGSSTAYHFRGSTFTEKNKFQMSDLSNTLRHTGSMPDNCFTFLETIKQFTITK